jgi:predicted CXXCH cytochrome family protein
MRRFIIIAIIGLSAFAILTSGGALGLENQDSFCASCHTEPETTFFARSQKNPTDLASAHAAEKIACIDCHSGSGTFGRIVGLQQGARDLFNYARGDYHRPAITTNPLGDETCVKCHAQILAAREGGSRAMNGHYHFYLVAWQTTDKSAAHCATCHTAHTTGLASLKFMAQGKVGKLCEDCHTALSGKITR